METILISHKVEHPMTVLASPYGTDITRIPEIQSIPMLCRYFVYCVWDWYPDLNLRLITLGSCERYILPLN